MTSIKWNRFRLLFFTLIFQIFEQATTWFSCAMVGSQSDVTQRKTRLKLLEKLPKRPSFFHSFCTFLVFSELVSKKISARFATFIKSISFCLQLQLTQSFFISIVKPFTYADNYQRHPLFEPDRTVKIEVEILLCSIYFVRRAILGHGPAQLKLR
jgi:hypothetical protein